MPDSLKDRVVRAAREEIARALGELCESVDAAESSLMLPRDDAQLVFFASTNPALMGPEAPQVPIGSSFSGVAYRTSQTIAVADAASQKQHFKAVDALVKSRTRELAAIPLIERSVFGVLTLVNRKDGSADSRPFDLVELRQAEALAKELAAAFAALPGLRGTGPRDADLALSLGDEFLADLTKLRAGERRIAHSLVSALIHNRAD